MSRLGWHIGDNLRWLAENPGAPRVPCGWLTGLFLNTVAEKLDAQGIEARERHDREAGHGPQDESPVAESDAP